MSEQAAGGVAERRVERDDGARRTHELDRVAVEEPLELRLAGDPLAVTMRTPGEDHLLAVGFLFSESILGSIDDVGAVVHCGRPGDDAYGNVLDVLPAPGALFDASHLDGTRRGTLTTSACGVCGRRSIEDLIARMGRVEVDVTIPSEVLRGAPGQLATHQPRFAHTGGVHAAAALTRDGNVLARAEDVGRHNAVDKVVGQLLYQRALAAPALLVVSGRVSFEIVQKAAAARIPAIAAVSAPTSLAIDLAVRAGITLAGFVREGRANLYSHGHRIR